MRVLVQRSGKSSVKVDGKTVGKIDKGFTVPVRDKKTRKQEWETLDDDLNYTKNDLDRTVLVPDHIRTVLQCYKDTIFTELFPEREQTWIPKTLIFAKDDNHAEEIVRIAREVFNKGNDFCKKITYNKLYETHEQYKLETTALIKNFEDQINFYQKENYKLKRNATTYKWLSGALAVGGIIALCK